MKKCTPDRDSAVTPEEAAAADQHVVALIAETGTEYFTGFAARFKREKAQREAERTGVESAHPRKARAAGAK